MTNVSLHKSECNYVRRKIHKALPACIIKSRNPAIYGYDFLIQNRLKVALRVSRQTLHRHTVRSNGRKYSYRYRGSFFNFHRHGIKIRAWDIDLFICIERSKKQRTILIIPMNRISGKTFQMHTSIRKPQYEGMYSDLINKWSVLETLLNDSHA